VKDPLYGIGRRVKFAWILGSVAPNYSKSSVPLCQSDTLRGELIGWVGHAANFGALLDNVLL